MKRLGILACCLLSVCSVAARDATGQSFFMPRSLALDTIYHNGTKRTIINHTSLSQRDYDRPTDKLACNLAATVVYNESDNDCDLAKYFLLDCKKQLVIDEQGNGDIGSGWLGLFGAEQDFRGTLSIRPERKEIGAVFHLHKDMSNVANHFWVDVYLPIVQVEHDLNLCETIETEDLALSSFPTIRAALNNPEWRFGKWSCRALCKTGVDDLLVQVGHRFYSSDHFTLDAYLQCLVPLGDAATSEFVFEPMVGSGRHFGFGGGLRTDADLYDDGTHKFTWYWDINYRYLFSRCEKRSLDIKCRPFSRYLILNRENSTLDRAAPAINILTQNVSVRPGSSLESYSTLNYVWRWVTAQVGGRFWWREAESIALKCKFDDGWSITAAADNLYLPEAEISDPFGVPGQGEPSTFEAITRSDVDLRPAAHNTAHSYTIFAAAAAHGIWLDHEMMAGIGGSYEFASRNTALELWSVWAMIGVGF